MRKDYDTEVKAQKQRNPLSIGRPESSKKTVYINSPKGSAKQAIVMKQSETANKA